MQDDVESRGGAELNAELGVPPTAAIQDIYVHGLHESFGDYEALLNSRDWLEAAIVNKGAKVTGKGCGLGGADLDILIDGFRFSVSIRPHLKTPNV